MGTLAKPGTGAGLLRNCLQGLIFVGLTNDTIQEK